MAKNESVLVGGASAGAGAGTSGGKRPPKAFVVRAAEKWLEIQPDGYVKSLVAELLDHINMLESDLFITRASREKVVEAFTNRIALLEKEVQGNGKDEDSWEAGSASRPDVANSQGY